MLFFLLLVYAFSHRDPQRVSFFNHYGSSSRVVIGIVLGRSVALSTEHPQRDLWGMKVGAAGHTSFGPIGIVIGTPAGQKTAALLPMPTRSIPIKRAFGANSLRVDNSESIKNNALLK
jgi:hypothetical protein